MTTGIPYWWWMGGLALVAVFMLIFNWYENRPLDESDEYCSRMDDQLNREKFLVGADLDTPALDPVREDMLWQGIEAEWHAFVDSLPTTREPLS